LATYAAWRRGDKVCVGVYALAVVIAVGIVLFAVPADV